MLPILVIALGLRWTSRPLHGVTGMVRRRAMGDIEVRVLPGGPADVRELAPELLNNGHYFKLLAPQQKAQYTARYQNAIGL